MRFDFHPTTEGWKVSEVNGDVPAGAAEGSILPMIAQEFCPQGELRGCVITEITSAFAKLIKPSGKVALIHATNYVEDKQVLVGFESKFQNYGIDCFYASPSQINWVGGLPTNRLDGTEHMVDGIIRYYPAEWLPFYKLGYRWQDYFEAKVPSCNHPVALYSQSKRLPLIWKDMGMDFPTWAQLLPTTTAPRLDNFMEENWIYKPAMSRVGDGVSIKEALSDKDYRAIIKEVKKYPKDWVSQKKFESTPLIDETGKEYHLCIGVFTVNGKSAGFYGRISTTPRIDEKAIDIPILVRNLLIKVKPQNEDFRQEYLGKTQKEFK